MATKTANAKSGGNIKVTLTAGLAHKMESQRKVVRALGLGKYGSSKVHADSPVIRGMVRKVSHLVTVEATSEAPQGRSRTQPKTK
jgi:large subunit ribosomal protein L30